MTKAQLTHTTQTKQRMHFFAISLVAVDFRCSLDVGLRILCLLFHKHRLKWKWFDNLFFMNEWFLVCFNLSSSLERKALYWFRHCLLLLYLMYLIYFSLQTTEQSTFLYSHFTVSPSSLCLWLLLLLNQEFYQAAVTVYPFRRTTLSFLSLQL